MGVVGSVKNFGVLIFSVIWVLSAQAKENAITLQELIDLSLKGSSIKAQKKYLEKAQTSYSQSRWNLYAPDLRWGVEATRSHWHNGPLYDEAHDSTTEGTTYSMVLSAKYKLFNGFQDFHHKERLGYLEKASQNELKDQQKLKIYRIRQSYVKLSADINILKESKASLDGDKNLFQLSQAKFKEGRIAQSELFRSQVQYQSSLQGVKSQEKAVKKAIVELHQLAEIAEESFVSIVPVETEQIPTSLQKYILNLKTQNLKLVSEKLFRLYKKTDPVQASQNQIQATAEYKDQVRGKYWPTLELFSNYYAQQFQFESTRSKGDYYVHGLSLTIPLFENLEAHYDYKRALLDNQIEVLNYEKKILDTQKNIDSLLISLMDEYENYQTLQENHKLLSVIYKTALKRFRQGAVSLKDVIDDKQKLDGEKLKLHRSTNNLQSVALDLERITGEKIL